jgi:hypothetical protein
MDDVLLRLRRQDIGQALLGGLVGHERSPETIAVRAMGDGKLFPSAFPTARRAQPLLTPDRPCSASRRSSRCSAA